MSQALEDFVPDWAAIMAVVLGVTAFALSQGLTYPLISLVLNGRGISEGLIGLNASVFAIGLAVATLSVGRLTAHIAGKGLIITGLIGCAMCLAAFALFDILWVWFVARFLLGFFASLIFMLGGAWLNTACPDRLRGRVSGLYGGGLCAGFAAGPLAIPAFGTENGFAFALLAVYLALVAFAVVVLSRKARTRPEPSPAGALLRFVRASPILVLMVLVFGFADIAAISIMPIYFVRTGHSEAFAAISVTAMALPTAFAQPLVGVLLDKMARPHVAIASSFIAAVSFMSIPLLTSEVMILAVFAVMGAACFALHTCAMTMLGERYTGGLLLAGTAVFTLAYAVGSAAGSTAAGAAMNFFGLTAGPLTAGLVLLAFGIVMSLHRR